MTNLEDKRCCPHCGEDFHQRPYLMARRATSNVLTLRQVAWILAAVLAILMLAVVVQLH